MESKYVEVRRGNVERLRVSVFERDGYACRYCGSKKPPFHLDHVYPVSKGGETTEDNLVTACAICNQKKHDKVGLWPRPIQHFETYKLPEFKTSVFLMFFGFLLTMGGSIVYFYNKDLGFTSFILLGVGCEYLGVLFHKMGS